MPKRDFLIPLGIACFAVVVWFFYWKLLLPPYLTFSDAAKFADVARNLIVGQGFGAGFGTFVAERLEAKEGLFSTAVLPFYPLLLSIGFKLLGVKDYVVILTSGVFYISSAVTLYFLGQKIFGKAVGFLSSLAFISDPAMINYASSGASESIFIFELILAALLFYQNTKKSIAFGFLTLIALYFTRPSAIIYISGFILFFIFLNFKTRKKILQAIGFASVFYFLIEALLIKFKFPFLYSPLSSFIFGTVNFSPLAPSTTTLRGGTVGLSFSIFPFLSKTFYDLYNFYKSLPQIISPYLAGLYLLSLFKLEKEKKVMVFKFLVLFFVLATFFSAAATLPIYRYLHPVAPFIYLLGVEFLVFILLLLFKSSKKVFLAGTIIVACFISGQTLGKILLDSRFIHTQVNTSQAPTYVKLAEILKSKTGPDDLIVTNLDTWGTWYGERKTIWYPVYPDQLIPGVGKKFEVDAIFLTSYKINDENYLMNNEWKKIFLSPEKIENKFIADNFKLGGIFEIKPEETYEKEGAEAVLLIRK